MGQQDPKRALRSRGGLKITLHDESGQESFLVETSGGQKLLLKNGPGQIEIDDGNGNSVKLGAGGITVNSATRVTINASQVIVNSGIVTVNAGMANFSGVIKCNTLISNSVVSASYSQGAGNIW